MSDYTLKRIDEIEAYCLGAMKRARAELGVTSFGLQVMDLPAEPDVLPGARPRRERAGGGLRDPRRLRARSSSTASATPGSIRSVMIRVGPDVRRKMWPGDDGMRADRPSAARPAAATSCRRSRSWPADPMALAPGSRRRPSGRARRRGCGRGARRRRRRSLASGQLVDRGAGPARASSSRAGGEQASRTCSSCSTDSSGAAGGRPRRRRPPGLGGSGRRASSASRRAICRAARGGGDSRLAPGGPAPRRCPGLGLWSRRPRDSSRAVDGAHGVDVHSRCGSRHRAGWAGGRPAPARRVSISRAQSQASWVPNGHARCRDRSLRSIGFACCSAQCCCSWH